MELKGEPFVSAVLLFLQFREDAQDLKMTPALAASVTDRLWTMEDSVELIDAEAPVPGSRGRYKKSWQFSPDACFRSNVAMSDKKYSIVATTNESAMANVTIYRFEAWDSANDEMRKSRRWGTREAIEQVARGRVLEETAREVDEAAVRSDIWGFTERDFNPDRTTGFSSQVRR